MPDSARSLARQQQQARSPELRERSRVADTKQIYNELERRTALESAVAQPDHAFLTQVEIRSVTLSDGTIVPIERINRRLGQKRGRIADYLDVAPEGTYTTVETKQWWELYGSYSKRGGVTGSRINPSSRLGDQLRRETNVFDCARRRGGFVNVRGKALDGQTVETSLNPQNYRGVSPTPYDIIPGN